MKKGSATMRNRVFFVCSYNGITCKIMATAKITSDTSHAQKNVCFWCSPKSMPVKPINKNVAGVSGEIGKPKVICPTIAARPKSTPAIPTVSAVFAKTGKTAK